MMTDAPTPHSPDAERAVLGGVILDNSKIDEAAATLNPDDFFLLLHRRVFTAMLALADAGVDISPITINEQVKTEGVVGAMPEIANLTYGLPHFTRLEPYVSILKRKTFRRRLRHLANDLTDRATGDEDEAQIALWLEQKAAEIRAQAGMEAGGFRTFAEVAVEAGQQYERLRHGDTRAVPTGYQTLDAVTRGGIQPGDLWVVAALTGRGKSAWALGAARQQAQRGYPCAVVSREMSDFENFARAHSAVSGVPAWRIEPGLKPDDYDRLLDSFRVMRELPIWINSRSSNIFEIRAQVRDLVRRHGVRTLFVDYLQLLTVTLDSRGATRAQEVSTCSRVLKEIAMDCGIGVFALAQFNRLAANGERPEIHHLAESSGIEKDASLVLILDMEDQREGSSSRECKMRIAKHRNGPLLSLSYTYRGDTLTFESAVG